MNAALSVLRLGEHFAQLTGEGECLPAKVDAAFWETDIAALPLGRLVSMLETGPAWNSWECHPSGEEFILQLAGTLALRFETNGGVEHRTLQEGEFIIVPEGMWHTAGTSEPGRAMFITPGEGTQLRPR